MTRCVVLVLLLLIGSVDSFAFSKGKPKKHVSKQVVYSANAKFYAEADRERGITTIYQIEKLGVKTKLWELTGVYQNFHVTDDGQIIAGVMDEWNMVKLPDVTMDRIKKAVVIEFAARDGKVTPVTLDRFIRNTKSLKKTDALGFYEWGQVKGFDEEGRYRIETVDRHEFLLSPITAETVSEQDLNPKRQSEIK